MLLLLDVLKFFDYIIIIVVVVVDVGVLCFNGFRLFIYLMSWLVMVS